MWANILLIMKDVSTPQRFWVLLPCHEKTFTKVEGKCITRVWKTTAWMRGLVVQRLFVQILTVFGSVRYNEAGRMHIGWVCWCSQITYCWDVGNVGAIPVSTAVLSAQRSCSLTRYTQTWPPRKINGRVRRCWNNLIDDCCENMSHKNGGRLCEIYESGCAWFRERHMRWKQTPGNVSVIMGKVLKKELRKT